MRWITLLGRIGTVILAIGLALFVFSLIPSGTRYEPGGSQPIGPEQYMLEELWVYLPQTGLQISVESTDNVRVYLLGVSQVELYNWKTLLREAYADSESPGLEVFIEVYTVPLLFFHEAYPEQTLKGEDLYDPQTQSMVWNVAVLDKGLQAHPEIILWNPPPGSAFSHELLPADALDIMVVIANPSSDTVEVDWKVKEIAAVAAKERVIVAARLLIPIGIALAIPWLVLRRVKKSTL
jgi:hypothetical protein